MLRNIAPLLLAIALAVTSCSGSSSKLTSKSEEKLAGGDAWRAWRFATRALDKEPGNPRAREAATAAGAAIVQEWQRKIRAFAETDTMKAAEQVLELSEFRGFAARYATIPMGSEWPDEERTIRNVAARYHYQSGREAADSGRPKKACMEFSDAERYVSGYRDVTKRADRAMGEALTRVALVPFRSPSTEPAFGVKVAQAWRDNLVQDFAPPAARFTRVLAGDAMERAMTLSELEGVSRDQAVRLGRKAGAQRVVWGSIGRVKSNTRLNFFRDRVARRIVEADHDGRESVRWVEVPIEVIARVRDVTVDVDYDVIATKTGDAIAHRHFERSTQARVVWTSYQPEGEPGSYSLVSETVRASNPDRARDVETRWRAACGDAVTLVEVLEARRKSGSTGHYVREALPRFAAGAAFVFLEELPPAEDLALTVLSRGSAPLKEDLLRLDVVDDVDLVAEMPGATSR